MVAEIEIKQEDLEELENRIVARVSKYIDAKFAASPMILDKEWYYLDEAAKYLCRSVSTTRGLVKKKLLQRDLTSYDYLISRESLQAYKKKVLSGAF